MPHLCSLIYAADEIMYNMQQSEATDWRSDIGNVCIWKLTHCGGHEWHSECSDSVSDIIKGHIIGTVSSTLACAVSPQPAWPTMGHLFFSHPHALSISQNVTHCLLFVFLFALFPCCFEQSLAVLIFCCCFLLQSLLFYVLPTLLKGPAWIYILLMLVWSSWWGSKPWVDQPAWCLWWSWLTLLDKRIIHPKKENGPTSDGFKPVWLIFFCGSQSYLE